MCAAVLCAAHRTQSVSVGVLGYESFVACDLLGGLLVTCWAAFLWFWRSPPPPPSPRLSTHFRIFALSICRGSLFGAAVLLCPFAVAVCLGRLTVLSGWRFAEPGVQVSPRHPRGRCGPAAELAAATVLLPFRLMEVEPGYASGRSRAILWT